MQSSSSAATEKAADSETYQQKMLCECPLVTAARPVARRGSCDGTTTIILPPAQPQACNRDVAIPSPRRPRGVGAARQSASAKFLWWTTMIKVIFPGSQALATGDWVRIGESASRLRHGPAGPAVTGLRGRQMRLGVSY